MSGAPAVAARTVVASTHSGRLLIPGANPSDVSFLDDGGQPVLVVESRWSPTTGTGVVPVVLMVEARGSNVALCGRLHRLAPGNADLNRRLHHHATCFVGSVEPGPVAFWRLDVEQVGSFDADGRRIPLSLLDYGMAEPDLFEAFAADTVEHLQESHADLVAAAAAELLELPTPGHLVAAAVSALHPDRLELDVVTAEGGWRLQLPMRPPLLDPHDVCERLRTPVGGA